MSKSILNLILSLDWAENKSLKPRIFKLVNTGGAYYKKLAFVDNVIIATPLGFLRNYCVTALCTRSEVAAHHGGSWYTVELLNETSLNE